MTNPAIESYKLQFADEVKHDVQQMKARTRGRVLEMPVNAEWFSYDELDVLSDHEKTARLTKTINIDPQYSRRWKKVREFPISPVWDTYDELAANMENGVKRQQLAKGMTMALARRWDRLVAEAAVGSVFVGKTHEQEISAAVDGVETVPHANIGMTFNKLLTTDEAFDDDEVGVDESEEFSLLLTNTGIRQLRNEIESRSKDYADDYEFQNGRLVRVGRYHLIPVSGGANSILSKVGNIRNGIAFARSGIVVGLSGEPLVKIDELPTQNYAWQLYSKLTCEAMRTNAKKVKIVQFDETHTPS